MNGHPPCPLPKSGLPTALLASCLLHLGLMILPHWGYRLEVSGLLGRDTPAVSAQILNITLMPRHALTETTRKPRIEPRTTPPTPTPTLPPQKPGATPIAQTEAISTDAENSILPLDAPRFYPSEQLTQSPVPLEFKELDSPETDDIIATGQMTIKLWIDEQGKVVHVSVEHALLPPRLVESTVQHFEQMRFTPGERYGQAVGSLITIEVDFNDGRSPQLPSSTSTLPTNP